MADETALTPVGYSDIVVGSAVAVGLDTALIMQTQAGGALISVEGAEIRVKFTGVPTATSGHLIDPPQANNAQPPTFRVQGARSLLGFLAIAVTGSATLRVSYFREG